MRWTVRDSGRNSEIGYRLVWSVPVTRSLLTPPSFSRHFRSRFGSLRVSFMMDGMRVIVGKEQTSRVNGTRMACEGRRFLGKVKSHGNDREDVGSFLPHGLLSPVTSGLLSHPFHIPHSPHSFAVHLVVILPPILTA